VDLSSTELIGTGRVEAITTVSERYSPADEPALIVVMVRLSQGPLILARAASEHAIGSDVKLHLVQTASGDFVPQTIG
jgi:uncharacterized OB-fold protein